LAGVDGGAVEDYGAGVIVLRGELEIVSGGALAGDGGRGGGRAVDGEEESAVRDPVAGEGNCGGGRRAVDDECAVARAESCGGEGESDLTG